MATHAPVSCHCIRTFVVHLGISRGMTKVRLGDHHPRDGPRDKPTELSIEDPRESINPQEVSTPTDVGRLMHSDENRIAIPEMAPGTNRLSSLSRYPEGSSIHRKFRPPPTLANLRIGRE
ncbi:hypothetical protein BHE74_00033367 [Ensete ventricosum]|nr:hypothetical protein BHE74_00033367 [Ensete ventricosum]